MLELKCMKTLSLILFFVSTGIHLYGSAISNKKIRNYTKPFILIALLMYYCFASNMIETTVILALIFSWIGDVFLIFKGIKWFTIGGISFMVSHFFFVLSYQKDVVFSKINIFVIISLALFFGTIVSLLFKKLKDHLPKALFYPMFLYLLINGTMNCFAIFRMLTNTNYLSIITCVGAILFFISDSCLFFVRFKKDCIQKNHFWVMLTYSLGELLIVLGLIG